MKIETLGVEELGTKSQQETSGGCGTFCGAVIGAVISVLWGDWDDFQQGREAAK